MKRISLAGKVCVYCGDPANSRDHVIPLSKGGNSLPENIVPCCRLCNSLARDNAFPGIEEKRRFILEAKQRYIANYRRLPFGAKLNAKRIKDGLTFGKLAKKVGFTNIEIGARRLRALFRGRHSPAVILVKAVERALEVNLDPEDYGFDAEELSGSL